MDPLWLLKGAPDAPGWTRLEIDGRAGTIDVVTVDPEAWALVRTLLSRAGGGPAGETVVTQQSRVNACAQLQV